MHLGYFRDELVTRRKWIDEAGYADLVALCQFLPGPASSQTGFALGLLHGGALGALPAWSAFTLPSALLLVLFAFGAIWFEGPVAVVAQAVWGMAQTLTPDRARASIALAAVLIVVFVGGSVAQVTAIAAGALAGLWMCRGGTPSTAAKLVFPVSRRAGAAALVVFFVLLVGLPLINAASGAHGVALIDGFYRAGALVFGGGHVVLPLHEIPQRLSAVSAGDMARPRRPEGS